MASKDKIVIYGHQASRASRPYWLLREYGMKIGEDFLEVDTGGPVTGFNDVRDTEEFLKLNPYRLIPVMKHGDVVLYESQAICQYIANVLVLSDRGKLCTHAYGRPQHIRRGDGFMAAFLQAFNLTNQKPVDAHNLL